MTEVKKWKVGEYGQPLVWTLTHTDGTPVTDLNTATEIKIIVNLEGTITRGTMEVFNVNEGKVRWYIPQGMLDKPGIAYMEIRALYATKQDITNTFKELVDDNVENL